MAYVYALEGTTPVVDESAFVHETAVLIGDVIVGPEVYLGPNAVLRGDMGRIVVERGANIQDNCTIHCYPGIDTVVAERASIGHGAVLHGCRVGKGALVGMNAVVMDEAVIGDNSIVAAMAFVKTGMQVPPAHLAAGLPAKVVRELSETEISWKDVGTDSYDDMRRRCVTGMVRTEPLRKVEADRRRIEAFEVAPLHRSRG